jgi:hypothetical protein
MPGFEEVNPRRPSVPCVAQACLPRPEQGTDSPSLHAVCMAGLQRRAGNPAALPGAYQAPSAAANVCARKSLVSRLIVPQCMQPTQHCLQDCTAAP